MKQLLQNTKKEIYTDIHDTIKIWLEETFDTAKNTENIDQKIKSLEAEVKSGQEAFDTFSGSIGNVLKEAAEYRNEKLPDNIFECFKVNGR